MRKLLGNGTLLVNESVVLPVRSDTQNKDSRKKSSQVETQTTGNNTNGAGRPTPVYVHVHGTDYWDEGSNPSLRHLKAIPRNTHVLVTHSPAKGYVDDGAGCPSILKHVRRVRPRLVVCGHIHQAHGVARGRGRSLRDTLFVNAASCDNGYEIGFDPVVVDI
mmetsp:Transcript_17590/g.33396  ORF Transcript_17590/g.33396 Transcript_17590/m.33396 type:complete len:162 (-) Transcript_17590:358-843(-)